MAKDKLKSSQVFYTEDFNMKLKQHLLDAEKVGARQTKAELIINLAMLGLQVEKKEIKIESE